MTKPVLTKTFKAGNSVAVRLPKHLSIPEGVEVELTRTGDAVTIRLARDAAAEKGRMLKWLGELQALPKPAEIAKREPIIFPKRRGL